MKIYVIGDVHGEWNLLNQFLNKKKPDIVLQCGDFGYWPNFNDSYELGNHIRDIYGNIKKKRKWYQCSIKNKDTKIYFCDGNHEDHWSLTKLENNEICSNIFYMKRGSILELPNKRKVLFIGGADSIDKHYRTIGIDWFPEEVISQKDIYNLPDEKIDIVISHTCPKEFLPELGFDFGKSKDCSCDALSYVLEKYRPKLWYFGHWHINKTGFTKEVRWFCLNMIAETNWFQQLI